jgi:hypothetical protein
MNFGGDNHAIIFSRYKRFGLAEIRQCSLEGNKTMGLRFKTSSAVIHTIHGSSICGPNLIVVCNQNAVKVKPE